MTILTEENLRRTAEVAMTRASWREVMASVGASESLAYSWLARSKHDAAEHLEGASPFYIEFPPHGFCYWHEAMKRSRAAFIVGFEAEVRDQVRGGIVETCFSPSDGRPLLALDPRYAHLTQAQFDALRDELDDPLDPRARYLWNADGTPVFQTRIVQAPGQLKIKALSALLPNTYGERAEVNHNVRGAVVHTIQPSVFVSKSERISSGQCTEGEFTEIQSSALERPDIAELRQKAIAHFANPNRQTTPQGIVRNLDGDPVNVGRPVVREDRADDAPLHKPTTPLHDNARMYQASTPAPERAPRPSYARDPHAVGARAMKVTR